MMITTHKVLGTYFYTAVCHRIPSCCSLQNYTKQLKIFETTSRRGLGAVYLNVVINEYS